MSTTHRVEVLITERVLIDGKRVPQIVGRVVFSPVVDGGAPTAQVFSMLGEVPPTGARRRRWIAEAIGGMYALYQRGAEIR